MAHYAFLDENNIVVEVITGPDEASPEDTFWEEHYEQFRGLRCKRTSYWTQLGVHLDSETMEPSSDQSKAFRKNYAGIGYRYDDELDAFIRPRPYPSWILDVDKGAYVAPIPRPDAYHVWNEDIENWVPEP